MSYSDPYQKITKIQDEALESEQGALERVKRNVLTTVAEQSRPFEINFKLVGTIAAGLMLAVAVIVYLWFYLGLTKDNGSVQPGAEPSRWVVATATQMETIAFEDKSKLVLLPGASARVLQTAPSAVRVLLEGGRAEVDVVHSKKTDWLLEAGPYTVAVTGTTFSIEWSGETQAFSLEMAEGQVVVTGPMLEEGKSIEAGERLSVWITERRMELSASRATIEASPPHTPPAVVSTDNRSPAYGHRNTRKQIRSAARLSNTDKGNEEVSFEPAGLTWRQMCRAGQFEAVVKQATSRGLHASIQYGSAEDLMALGEAARLTRNRTVANEAYQAVRRRFVGSPQFASAAFYLGKIAFDQHRAYGVAARWMGAYLQEQQTGPFAKDALGKLFDAERRTGKLNSAKHNAQLYIERFPNGAHAPLAQEILME